jgi:MYXO-CTERM domain-containing protein
MALVTTDAAAVESMQTVPGAGGAVIDTKILLKNQPAPVPFEKTESEKPEKQEAKAPDANKSVIPEPAAAALGLIGLGLILFRRYRV